MPAESESDFVSPYTADEKARILGSVLWKPGVDQERLFRVIKLGAIKCVYLRQAQGNRPDRPFSKQLEYWEPVALSLLEAKQRLESVLADPFRYLEIETAIANRPHGRTRRSCSAEKPKFDPPQRHVWAQQWVPPPVTPSLVPIGQSVPETVSDILIRAQFSISQAQALIQETVLFACEKKTRRRKDGLGSGERAAGRIADQALYDFVKLITSQYWMHAASPRVPARDRVDSEKGTESAAFLSACIRPIGVSYDGPAGIVSLWRRVKKSMPRGWPKSERQ